MNKNTQITKVQYKEVVKSLKEEILKLSLAQKVRKIQFKDAQRSNDWSEQNRLRPGNYSDRLTALHIIYNEFRNKPPHTDQDERLKSEYSIKCDYQDYEKMIQDILLSCPKEEEVA
jgi:hypothetical protein